ncbi:MAG: hypothetical protein D6711_09860 [Chloroflexi bacterium]|nr:MAG: hypothetical protein D6711_09860 [Chloroflexota bacterium]
MNKKFMELVQTHERAWGKQTYPGRPDMFDIFQSPVVVFWESTKESEQPYTITLHESLEAVEKYFLRLLFSRAIQTTDKRIAHVFQNQKRMVISEINIKFKEDQNDN